MPRRVQTIVCSCVTTRIGSPFRGRELRDSRRTGQSASSKAPKPAPRGADAAGSIHGAATTGTYSVHIFDVKFGGLQHYVYRLTVNRRPFLLSAFFSARGTPWNERLRSNWRGLPAGRPS